MFKHRESTSTTWSAVENDAKDEVIALVEAALNGDEEAWRRLHARFTPRLRMIAAKHRLGEADIADVVQSTWSKCFENLARLREPAALPGWLSTTCRHEAVKRLRARARCVPMDFYNDQVALVPLADVEAPAAGDPLATILTVESRELVRALLDELGPRDRNLIRTLIEDDISYRRVAELLDMPIGSIGPTRQRIVAKLRQRARVVDLAA